MLQGISLFEGLSESESSTVSLFAQERKILAGDILFHEGDDATAMYVVKSWTLKAYKDRSTGEQILGYIRPMEILGEMALFDNDAPKKRVASVRAMEDSQLLVIVDYAIVELGKKHPVVYEKIADVIRKRSAENNKKNS